MQFSKSELYISTHRINRYFVATGKNKVKTIKLYKANLKIAQAFHPILGVLEVTLRNCINTILISHFADFDWIINQKRGFMVDSSLTHIDRRTGRKVTNNFLKFSVEKSENRFNRLRIPITSGKIIADQTLGFWTDLFEVHHYRLLLGRPIQIFNNIPSGHGRKDVCDRLNKIRQFRNRINHNEPICFNGSLIDFKYVEEVYEAIIEILKWIDPDLIIWIKNIDSVKTKIISAKLI